MAYGYRRKRYRRRSSSSTGFMAMIYKPFNALWRMIGIKSVAFKYTLSTLGMLVLLKVFWEDGESMIQEKLDDFAEWIQDAVGM